MEYHETRTNEFTGIKEIDYASMFPEIGRVELTPDECTLALNGQPIPRKQNSEYLF